MESNRATPHPSDRTPTDDEIDIVDGTVPTQAEVEADADADGDRLDDGIFAADDTGMLAGERMITLVELDEGHAGAGNV